MSEVLNEKLADKAFAVASRSYYPLTTKLNDGRTVLAKQTEYGVSAMTFANRTQAYRRADELNDAGTKAAVVGRWPFYVMVEESPK